jgi:hypothetical protein
MRIFKYLLTVLLLVIHTSGFSQRYNSPEILIKEWERMWNTYDLSQVDRLFAADQSVTYFSSEYAGIIRGIEALRNHHAKFGFVSGGKQSGNKLWLDETRYELQGNTCLVTATWYFQREASEQRQAGPVTFVLEKSGGAWRIKHAHFSNNP